MLIDPLQRSWHLKTLCYIRSMGSANRVLLSLPLPSGGQTFIEAVPDTQARAFEISLDALATFWLSTVADDPALHAIVTSYTISTRIDEIALGTYLYYVCPQTFSLS
jgi:hypothetical protein